MVILKNSSEARKNDQTTRSDALSNEKDKTALHHYYHQFDFHRECIPADLTKMSKAEPASLSRRSVIRQEP